MEKPPITSHKSHSPAARLGVRHRGAPPPCWGSGAACRVDQSVPGELRARRDGRLTTASAAMAGTMTSTVAPARRRVWPKGPPDCPAGPGRADSRERCSAPGTGCANERVAACRGYALSRVQKGTRGIFFVRRYRVRRSGWLPLLSHCESLTTALDLQLTTMRNIPYL